MATKVTIRKAVITDARAASDAVRRSITELCVQDHQGDGATIAAWLANKTEDQFKIWITSDRLIALVAENVDGVVGFGLMNRSGSVSLLYVSPDVRFQGVSKKLLLAMEDAARSVGLQRLTLASTETARGFYLS